jgi:WD40 repeat protein
MDVLFDGVVNKRRCQEAGHHLVAAGKFVEAQRELCSLAAVCTRARTGLIFQLFGELGELKQLNDRNKRTSDRVDHYIRWMMRDSHFLDRSPLQIGVCTTQPFNSIARNDFLHLKKQLEFCSIGSAAMRWCSGSVLGGRHGFGADLNILVGHDGTVNGVCFSPTEGLLASCSEDKTIRLWNSFTGQSKKDTIKNILKIFSEGVTKDQKNIKIKK